MFIDTLKPLTNYDITKLENELKIKNFRGVYMRDTLPDKINEIECGVVNLDISKNTGTHWVCYLKNKERCYYFDSFGLDPPLELQKYLNSQIELSTFQIQNFNTHHCGYYCLLFLKLMDKYDFKEIVLDSNDTEGLMLGASVKNTNITEELTSRMEDNTHEVCTVFEDSSTVTAITLMYNNFDGDIVLNFTKSNKVNCGMAALTDLAVAAEAKMKAKESTGLSIWFILIIGAVAIVVGIIVLKII